VSEATSLATVVHARLAAARTTRLPGGEPGDPALMTSAQVSTFLHEFGHLVQALSSGRQSWTGLSRVRERDFIEAPSQLLEEWASDPVTLATFARHHAPNEPIPSALVIQMGRANQFGRGLRARQQMVLPAGVIAPGA
jgi:thimet oligopeptidase